jgi:hypothetical protein
VVVWQCYIRTVTPRIRDEMAFLQPDSCLLLGPVRTKLCNTMSLEEVVPALAKGTTCVTR